MKNKSFTLIELLVVIVIIGILAGVIMISTSSSIDKANFAKAQAFSSTVQNELLSNLVSEWTFDNASNIGEDTWGNNDGTLYNFSNPATSTSGLASSSECVFGTCLKFDGNDDYVLVNIDSDTSNGFTFSAWYKWLGYSDGVASAIAVINSHGTNNGSFDAIIYVDYLDLRAFGGITFGHYKINSNHDWHFITLTVNSNGKGVSYYDGQIIGNDTTSIEDFVSGNMYIGQYVSGVYNFNGYIDDVRVYKGALSSSQIKQNYIAGLDSLLSQGGISKEGHNARINELAYDN
jgi:prepilin-type N-terminal cleavage/methylation domain-containing protein